MESFEYPGQWWVATQPDAVASGTLSFTNEAGLTLDLNGSFREIKDIFSHLQHIVPLVLGVTKQGKKVSLLNCDWRGTSTNSAGYTTERYYCHFAFIGAHFASPDELTFHKATVQFSHLPDWIGKSGLTFGLRQYQGSSSIDEFHLSYEHPNEVPAPTSKGTVTITYGIRTSGEPLTSMTFSQDHYLRIEPISALSVEDLLKQYIIPLQYLVGLGTNRPNSLTGMEVYSALKTQPVKEGDEREIPIEVFFASRYTGPREEKRLYPHDMLFWYGDIAEDFTGVLERWLALPDTLDSVYQLYFAIQQTPMMYIEQKFAYAIQAVESYHRRRMSRPGPPSEEHVRKVEAILSAVPAEYRDWLQGELRHSHEPSLRQRLKELYYQTKAVISPLCRRRESFVHKAVSTRNYMAHYDPAAAQQAVTDPTELFFLTGVLIYMLKMLFLLELGLTPERCAELFKRNNDYLYATSDDRKV